MSCHLPGGFGMGWATLLKYKSLALSESSSFSLTPHLLGLKRPLTPHQGQEGRRKVRPKAGALRHTVHCGPGPPRPNPRSPSSRPHPPPSWSGAHTDRWNGTSVETLSPSHLKTHSDQWSVVCDHLETQHCVAL